MGDPDVGMRADGMIVAGVRRDRVPAPVEPIPAAAVDMVGPTGADIALQVYGSVLPC
jgi:hypothetical protein